MSTFLIIDDNRYGMAAYSCQVDNSATCAELPDIVPFDLPYLSQLSWELGSRVTGDDESSLHSTWEHTRTSWMLSICRVTSNTVVMCVCTPIGRERFYGTAQSNVTAALPNLKAAPHWQQLA
jgi:hypothetical protein